MKTRYMILACLILVTFGLFLTQIGFILTPTPPDVELITDKSMYLAGETITITLKNNGDKSIEHSFDLGFYQRLLWIWIPPTGAAPRQAWFNPLALTLLPGGNFTQVVGLAGAVPGTYRVEKWIANGIVFTEFTVEGIDYLPLYTVAVLTGVVIVLSFIWYFTKKIQKQLTQKNNVYDYHQSN